MAKSRVEESIRDKLSTKLDLIETGLVLIQDEYHLKNPNGAGGFIDLFAKDTKGNLVIIELKRSDAASREAITELSKYIALIRRAKNVRNSEVRLLVISTEWHELRVPFSEFYHATNYQLEGYQLFINESNDPIKVERVNPLPNIEGRQICRRHFVRYYKNNTDLEKACKKIASEAKRLGIGDFLLAKFSLNFKDEYYGVTKVLYWAQQLKSREFYIEKLTSHLDNESLDEILSYIEEMDDDDAVDELADRLDDEMDVHSETCEIGHPEKLVQKLSNKLWKLESISKHGVFNEDERLTDELLLMDLKGMTGASFVYFFSSSKTDNRSKFEEIRKGIETCLFYNDLWRHKIIDILNYAGRKANATVTIYIYSKDDILETIWQSGIDNPLSWTPTFYIVIDPNNTEDLEIFRGKLVWTPMTINLDNVISETFEGFNNYMMKRHFGLQRADNAKIMNQMGFNYQVDFSSFGNNAVTVKQNISIRGNTVSENSNSATKYFDDFLLENVTMVNQIVNLFESRHFENGVFSYGEPI